MKLNHRTYVLVRFPSDDAELLIKKKYVMTLMIL